MRLVQRLRPAAIVSLLSLTLAACGGSGEGDRSWPAVRVTDAAGTELSSSSVITEGRPSVIAIWGITCAACRQELPRLEELAASSPEVDVAAVNYGDDPEDIAEYLAELGLDLRVFIDDEARLTEALGVSSLPATVFVHPDGTIENLHFGELSASELEQGVEKLLAA
jgi:thiol-disulfide isomerase/thioredoxin